MELGGKTFELTFKYGQLKKIAQHIGCEMHDVTEKVVEMGDNPTKIADFCVVCLFYGSNAFDSIEEIENSVSDFDELRPVVEEFLKQWKMFFKLKTSNETGE